MILDIFDQYTGLRLGFIKSYEFVQYEDKFNGVGDFSVTIPYVEETFNLLHQGNFILFNPEDMGVIRYRERTSEDQTVVMIKGFMLNKILDWRVIPVTNKFSGNVTQICRDAVERNFITPENSKRKIDFITLEPLDTQRLEAPLKTQETGSTVENFISGLLDTHCYGHKLVPIIKNYDEELGVPTNLSEMQFRVIKPVDRTYGNVEHNPPVIFSFEMNNMQQLTYVDDATEFCSTAYVAGEGEGSNRVIVESGDTDSWGTDRIELYVDARDLQSEDPETGEITTEEEYMELLDTRGRTQLEEHITFESFSGQISEGNINFELGKDFNNGDYVTIADKQLNIYASVQVTSVIHSSSNGTEKVDLVFGYEKAAIKQLLKKKGVI